MTEEFLECIGDAYGYCVEKAVYLRMTQFAGNHPLCEKHAKEDDQFMINDSYTCWKKL